MRAWRDEPLDKDRCAYVWADGTCERFHKTILQEFYQITFRKNIYEDIDQLQIDLDLWIEHYNPVS